MRDSSARQPRKPKLSDKERRAKALALRDRAIKVGREREANRKPWSMP